jgi:hypothetical protein
VPQESRTIRPITPAVTSLVLGFAWFATVLYVILGNVIIRDTALGRFAHLIDRLPTWLAKFVVILCWGLFFLGWIFPLLFGFKRLFQRSTGKR